MGRSQDVWSGKDVCAHARRLGSRQRELNLNPLETLNPCNLLLVSASPARPVDTPNKQEDDN